MIRAAIAALFPKPTYVLGFGWIGALPGGLAPRPQALRDQNARQQQAEGRRGGFVHHDNAGAA